MAASIGLALALTGERVVGVARRAEREREPVVDLNADGNGRSGRRVEGLHAIEDVLQEIKVEAPGGSSEASSAGRDAIRHRLRTASSATAASLARRRDALERRRHAGLVARGS